MNHSGKLIHQKAPNDADDDVLWQSDTQFGSTAVEWTVNCTIRSLDCSLLSRTNLRNEIYDGENFDCINFPEKFSAICRFLSCSRAIKALKRDHKSRLSLIEETSERLELPIYPASHSLRTVSDDMSGSIFDSGARDINVLMDFSHLVAPLSAQLLGNLASEQAKRRGKQNFACDLYVFIARHEVKHEVSN